MDDLWMSIDWIIHGYPRTIHPQIIQGYPWTILGYPWINNGNPRIVHRYPWISTLAWRFFDLDNFPSYLKIWNVKAAYMTRPAVARYLTRIVTVLGRLVGAPVPTRMFKKAWWTLCVHSCLPAVSELSKPTMTKPLLVILGFSMCHLYRSEVEQISSLSIETNVPDASRLFVEFE